MSVIQGLGTAADDVLQLRKIDSAVAAGCVVLLWWKGVLLYGGVVVVRVIPGVGAAAEDLMRLFSEDR